MEIKFSRFKCFLCNRKCDRLYKLPRNEKRLKEWLRIIEKEELIECNRTYLNNNSRLCDDHFDDWAFTSTIKNYLVRAAYPKRPAPTKVPAAAKASKTNSESNLAAADTSEINVESNLEVTWFIKEEPIDIDEDPVPSTSRAGYGSILPCTDPFLPKHGSTSKSNPDPEYILPCVHPFHVGSSSRSRPVSILRSSSVPSVEEAFTIKVKKEPVDEEPQQITTTGKDTNPSDQPCTAEQSEDRPAEEDSVKSNIAKDSFDSSIVVKTEPVEEESQQVTATSDDAKTSKQVGVVGQSEVRPHFSKVFTSLVLTRNNDDNRPIFVKTEPVDEEPQPITTIGNDTNLDEQAGIDEQSVGINEQSVGIDEQSEETLSFEEESESSNHVKDGFDEYGEYIARQLRKLDLNTCAKVQKAFESILFDAEMGRLK